MGISGVGGTSFQCLEIARAKVNNNKAHVLLLHLLLEASTDDITTTLPVAGVQQLGP